MFYKDQLPAVFRLCRFQTGNAETARDLCQETFARAFRARRDLVEPAAARAWVLRIALNECRSEARRLGLRRFLSALLPGAVSRLAGFADATPGPEETVEVREGERRVRDAARELPPREREAFLLVALEGLDYRTAATVLDAAEPSVRQAVCRARRRLRVALGDRRTSEPELLEPAGGRP